MVNVGGRSFRSSTATTTLADAESGGLPLSMAVITSSNASESGCSLSKLVRVTIAPSSVTVNKSWRVSVVIWYEISPLVPLSASVAKTVATVAPGDWFSKTDP